MKFQKIQTIWETIKTKFQWTEKQKYLLSGVMMCLIGVGIGQLIIFQSTSEADKNLVQTIDSLNYKTIQQLDNVKFKEDLSVELKYRPKVRELNKYNIQLRELYANLQEYKDKVEEVTEEEIPIETKDQDLKNYNLSIEKIQKMKDEQIEKEIKQREITTEKMSKDYDTIADKFNQYLKDNNVNVKVNEIYGD